MAVASSDQYRELSSYLLGLIKNEHRQTTYSHLRTPNNNAGKYSSTGNIRPKFKIIARSPYLIPTGTRNLDIGSNEVLMEIKGSLNNSLDYRMGIENASGILRFCVGENIIKNDLLHESLGRHFTMYNPMLRSSLKEGDFPHFVSQSMQFINDTLQVYKKAEPALRITHAEYFMR